MRDKEKFWEFINDAKIIVSDDLEFGAIYKLGNAILTMESTTISFSVDFFVEVLFPRFTRREDESIKKFLKQQMDEHLKIDSIIYFFR